MEFLGALFIFVISLLWDSSSLAQDTSPDTLACLDIETEPSNPGAAPFTLTPRNGDYTFKPGSNVIGKISTLRHIPH